MREEEAMFEGKQASVRPASAPLADVGSVGAMELNLEIAIIKSQVVQMMEMINLLAAKITTMSVESVTGSNLS